MAETYTTATKPKPKRTTSAKKTGAPKTGASTKKTRNPVVRVQDATEKAVLVQVGAVLIARDYFVDAVTGIASTDVKTAERRGITARKNVERQLRARRANLAKQARANRRRVEHDIKNLRTEFEVRTERSRAAVDQIVETGRKVAERVPKVPTRA